MRISLKKKYLNHFFIFSAKFLNPSQSEARANNIRTLFEHYSNIEPTIFEDQANNDRTTRLNRRKIVKNINDYNSSAVKKFSTISRTISLRSDEMNELI